MVVVDSFRVLRCCEGLGLCVMWSALFGLRVGITTSASIVLRLVGFLGLWGSLDC